MKMRISRRAGFTLIEIMIVVGIIGLLAAIAVPNLVRARQTSQSNACINNLRQVESAKQQWAAENGKANGDTPTQADILVYIGRGGSSGTDVCCPLAPKGTVLGGYDGRFGDMLTLPTCSYYANPGHKASLDPTLQ